MNMYVLIKKKNKTNSTKKVVKWGEGKDGLKNDDAIYGSP